MAQSYSNFELVIVDDGSRDDTSDVLAEFVRDPRVVYVQHDGVARRRRGPQHGTEPGEGGAGRLPQLGQHVATGLPRAHGHVHGQRRAPRRVRHLRADRAWRFGPLTVSRYAVLARGADGAQLHRLRCSRAREKPARDGRPLRRDSATLRGLGPVRPARTGHRLRLPSSDRDRVRRLGGPHRSHQLRGVAELQAGASAQRALLDWADVRGTLPERDPYLVSVVVVATQTAGLAHATIARARATATGRVEVVVVDAHLPDHEGTRLLMGTASLPDTRVHRLDAGTTARGGPQRRGVPHPRVGRSSSWRRTPGANPTGTRLSSRLSPRTPRSNRWCSPTGERCGRGGPGTPCPTETP